MSLLTPFLGNVRYALSHCVAANTVHVNCRAHGDISAMLNGGSTPLMESLEAQGEHTKRSLC